MPNCPNSSGKLSPYWCFQLLLAKGLRLFYKLLYHQLAWSYDLVSWVVSSGHWQDWILSVIPLLKPPSILEIGSGPGHLQVALAQRQFNAFGLDQSPQMIRQASRRLRQMELPPKTIRGTAQNLPFKTSIFDSIVATFPSEFIFDSGTISEVARVLKPGGKFITLLGVKITGRNIYDRFLALLFSITGEEPREALFIAKFISSLNSAGFVVEITRKLVENGDLWILESYRKEV